MVKVTTAVLMIAVTLPTFAQPTSTRTPAAEKPIDNRPPPSGVNGADQGGGVVLQGAHEALTPTPKPTPPGQSPAGSVEALPLQSPNTPPSKAADD